MTLEIPDSVVSAISSGETDLTAEVKRELALSLYGRGVLSAGKAAELAGVGRMSFESILAKGRMERPFSEEDLAREIAAGE